MCVGNVKVFGLFGQFSEDPDDKHRYCSPVLFWFAFAVTTASYIPAAVIVVGICYICTVM